MCRKKLLAVISVLALIFLFGCTKVPKENEVYVVKETTEAKDIEKIDKQINTEGINPFYSISTLNIKENITQIPLTLAKDKEYVFYMKPTAAKVESSGYLIKGEALSRVDIIKVHITTADTRYVVSNVPFISSVKWNKEGNMVAFLGGNTLTVYNDEDNKLIQSFVGDGGGITSFGWSPDGKKLYTEGQDLINTGIYYVDSKKYVHSYETKENLYYKGVLDNQYFYATERIEENYYTTIVDKDDRTAIRTKTSGRYRDSYKKSFLQVGKDNFGLEYYLDINNPSSVKEISKEYINDAKFMNNGWIVYITPNDNSEENNFYLHILNEKGEEIKKLQVYGSKIIVLSEGKIGYIGGEQIERVDLQNYKIERSEAEDGYEERKNLFRTLRAAVDVIYKYELTGKKDIEQVKKYIVDSSNPEQWAFTDVMNVFNEDLMLLGKASDYNIALTVKSLNIKKDSASAVVNITARSSSGSSESINNAVELIKKDNKWYVTGMSTFPYSKQQAEVKAKVEEIIKQAQQGKLFNGELKDKEIQIGQIQFWQLSEPHLADNIDSANYCKVYLKVKEEEVLYKLILDRKNQSYWKATSLSKDKLSKLF